MIPKLMKLKSAKWLIRLISKLIDDVRVCTVWCSAASNLRLACGCFLRGKTERGFEGVFNREWTLMNAIDVLEASVAVSVH